MKHNIIKKIILTILILTLVLGTNSIFLYSYSTTTYTYSSTINTLPENFDSLYPGYKSLLDTLVTNHPNWTFNLYETGLDWDTVLNNEAIGHGSDSKNMSPANSSSYSGEWICEYCGATPVENGSWYCTSRKGIAYMMDPRNSINESDLFQFQELYSSSADSQEIVAKSVEGTFINNSECINAIVTASSTYGVSSLHLVARIIQEQGNNGSTLGLGITENGVTYYNLFNIGAYGDSKEKIIERGLQTAKDNGWTSMEASIIGGASFLKDKYINQGQNTLYYQKFNVVYQEYLYNHQYMQNILAAQNEGTRMRGYYVALEKLESNFTFNIPLYSNMPEAACSRPDTSKPLDKPALEDRRTCIC